MRIYFVALSLKGFCFWVGNSSILLCRFKVLSPTIDGNNGVVLRQSNPTTHLAIISCCFPLTIFNLDNKLVYKIGKSIITYFIFKDTLSMRSHSLDLVVESRVSIVSKAARSSICLIHQDSQVQCWKYSCL